MENGISITANRNEKKNYRGSMYLGFTAFFCGVISVILFFNGLNAISYTKEIVYLLAFLLSALVCFMHYNKPKFILIVWSVVLVITALSVVAWFEDIQIQINSMYTAFSSGTAAVRNVTKLMCLITVILVGLFYLFELVFKVHFILSVLLSALIIVSPVLKINISAFNIFTVIVYLVMFYVIKNSLISRRKLYTTDNVNIRRSVLEKSATSGLACAITAFVVAGIIMNVMPVPVYNSVSVVQGAAYNIIRRINGSAKDITMDGSISTGNNYQTGAEQLKLTANRKPEEDIYLAGYIGGEYTGNNWTVTDDYTICDEWDAANPDAASYNSISHTSDAFNNLYYSYNFIVKSGNAALKSKDRRVQLNIEYTGKREDNTLKPYCSNLYANQMKNMKDYDVYYYEQQDMTRDWSASRGGHTEVVKISDYERVERNYKEAMQPYYTKYSETITPKIYDYVQDNPLVSLLSEKTTFIIYTLMSNTRYTRTPGVTLGSSDIADRFLFESKRGYCVHYATVATLMYRMYGIPARYVTGFKVPADSFKENEDGQWYASVSDARQHAWTEIFIDSYGWVPVDVTPDKDGVINVSYPGYDMDTFRSVMESNNWSVGSPSIQNVSNDDVKYVRTWQGAVKAAITRFVRNAVKILKYAVIIIIIGTIICSPWLLRLRRKLVIKRQNTKKCNIIYNRMMEMLHKCGYVKEYDGTEENFADALMGELGSDIKGDIVRAVNVCIESEFSDHRAETEYAKQVYDVYKEVSALVYNSLGWRKKFAFKYVYCFG